MSFSENSGDDQECGVHAILALILLFSQRRGLVVLCLAPAGLFPWGNNNIS